MIKYVVKRFAQMITIAKVSALQMLSEKLCSHLPIKTTAYMPLQPL